MTKRGSSTFKLILFSFGCLIFLAGRLLVHIPLITGWVEDYAWIAVFLIYVVWFLPFLLVTFSLDRTGVLSTGGAVYYRGAGLYTVLSLVLIGVVLRGGFNLPVIFVVHLALVFLFLVYLYLSLFAGGHVTNVQVAEQEKASQLNHIKTIAADLCTVAQATDNLNVSLKERIGKLTADLRYISPSGDRFAQDLEKQMTDLLISLSAQISSGGVNEDAIIHDLDQLTLAYQRRKNTN